MKTGLFSLLTLSALGLTSSASTLIFSDNFDGPDAPNFDNADPTGTSRRAGTAATDIRLRSSRRQHTIVGNQVDLAPPGGGSGRLRFHEDASLGDWFDWSSGAVGALITSSGGFRVDFDWTPANNTGTQWVSWNVGFSQGPEPGLRVNEPETDFGILFRNNGGSQYLDNGAATNGANSAATTVPRHITIEYSFSSWADGSTVGVTASVDGTTVLPNYTFDWNNNTGGVSFELGTNIGGGFVDNVAVSTIPEPSAAALTGLVLLGLVTRRRRI